MFFVVNMTSGGLAAAGSLTIVYLLDYALNVLLQVSVLKVLRRVARLLEGDGFWPQVPLFPLRWFRRLSRRYHPVSWFPARGLRHHHWSQPVQERHWSLGLHFHFFRCTGTIIEGAGISYPFDTVRRRLKLQAENPVEQHIYKGTTDCFKKTVAEVGISACLHKRFFAIALRSVGGALVLMLYDRAKTYLASAERANPWADNFVCLSVPTHHRWRISSILGLC